MLPTRSIPELHPDTLLAVACLLAGLGFGLTGLSLLADGAVGCLGCGALADAPVATLAALGPALAGAALTTAGGWLFGRRH